MKVVVTKEAIIDSEIVAQLVKRAYNLTGNVSIGMTDGSGNTFWNREFFIRETSNEELVQKEPI